MLAVVALLGLWWLVRVKNAMSRSSWRIALPAVIAYFGYMWRHKQHVWLAGRSLAQPCSVWQLLIHDWSKFMPCEFGPYAYHFNVRTKQERRREDPRFDRAWLHHIHLNPHHWDYWVLRVGSKVTALRVPEKYIREMAADWLGMARQRGGDDLGWYKQHTGTIHMHPASRSRIEVLIGLIEEMPDVAETGDVVGIGGTYWEN